MYQIDYRVCADGVEIARRIRDVCDDGAPKLEAGGRRSLESSHGSGASQLGGELSHGEGQL